MSIASYGITYLPNILVGLCLRPPYIRWVYIFSNAAKYCWGNIEIYLLKKNVIPNFIECCKGSVAKQFFVGSGNGLAQCDTRSHRCSFVYDHFFPTNWMTINTDVSKIANRLSYKPSILNCTEFSSTGYQHHITHYHRQKANSPITKTLTDARPPDLFRILLLYDCNMTPVPRSITIVKSAWWMLMAWCLFYARASAIVVMR